jgi:hypothetical protein
LRHDASFPARCCLCVHGFRFSRVKEHYVVSTRSACQTRARQGWYSAPAGSNLQVPGTSPRKHPRAHGNGKDGSKRPRLIRVSPMPPSCRCENKDCRVRLMCDRVALRRTSAPSDGTHSSGRLLIKDLAVSCAAPYAATISRSQELDSNESPPPLAMCLFSAGAGPNVRPGGFRACLRHQQRWRQHSRHWAIS